MRPSPRPADDPQIRVVVLTGAGEKAFVAGADIAEMNELTRCRAAISRSWASA